MITNFMINIWSDCCEDWVVSNQQLYLFALMRELNVDEMKVLLIEKLQMDLCLPCRLTYDRQRHPTSSRSLVSVSLHLKEGFYVPTQRNLASWNQTFRSIQCGIFDFEHSLILILYIFHTDVALVLTIPTYLRVPTYRVFLQQFGFHFPCKSQVQLDIRQLNQISLVHHCPSCIDSLHTRSNIHWSICIFSLWKELTFVISLQNMA